MILTHGANSLKRDNLSYFTDFSNFDTVNKIDHPKIGPVTDYTNSNLSYSLENGVLVATSLSTSYQDKGLKFTKKDGTILRSEFLIEHPTSSIPSFLWTGDFFGFDNDYARSNFEFLLKQSISYTLYNNTYKNRTDSGYNWFSYPVVAGSSFFTCEVRFVDSGLELYVDNVHVITTGNISDNCSFIIRPMQIGKKIKCKYIKIWDAASVVQ